MVDKDAVALPIQHTIRAWTGTDGKIINVDDFGDAFVMIDECQNVLVFNQSACEMFGYEEAEVVGHPLKMLLPQDIGDRHRSHIASFAAGPVAHRPMSDHRTLMGRRRTGEEFPVEISIGKAWSDGRLVLSATIRDITDLRHNEIAQAALIDQLTALMQHASDGVIVTDAQGTISYASPFVEKLVGASSGGLVGSNYAEAIHPGDLATFRKLYKHALADHRSSVDYDVRIHSPGGHWIWIEAATSLLYDPSVAGFVTNFRDITEDRLARARRLAVEGLSLWALRNASVTDLFDRAVQLSFEFLHADAAVICERVAAEGDHIVARASAGWPQRLIGRAFPALPSSLMGKALADGNYFIVSDYADTPRFPGKEEIDRAGIKSSLGVVIAGGDKPWGSIGVLSTLPNVFGEADISFIQAIASVLASAVERARIDAERAEQALHDPLTGLPNRALLNDRVELALASSRRSSDENVVLLFIDVDNFKQVNDTLGHDAGDDLLCEVARRFGESLRPEDTAARFGGDEFVIVTSLQPGWENALAFGNRILNSFKRPCHVGGTQLYVTVSIGIAISKNQLDSVSVLLQHGDFAMYEAKKFGRDCCVVYEEGQRTPLVARASLEQDLRSALERGQMMIYYQPVVDSDTGLKVSCEALLRWACPGRGLVSPGEFIPILEESGMILPFGRWVLQRACEQLGRWQVDFQRFDLTVSVNLSPRQLNDPELIPSIEHALASSGVAPSSLNVEITETMIVDDLERAKSTLEAIGNLGVDLLIDDFGTGYSSLSYLKRLPVACIKIDRSFISNICEDPADQAIVAAVSELARRLNVYTVAEGVETAEQLTLVRSLGCTLIQGFYYSPALPAREFAASWLASLDHSDPELVALGSTQRPSPTANMHGAECPIRAEEQV